MLTFVGTVALRSRLAEPNEAQHPTASHVRIEGFWTFGSRQRYSGRPRTEGHLDMQAAPM